MWSSVIHGDRTRSSSSSGVSEEDKWGKLEAVRSSHPLGKGSHHSQDGGHVLFLGSAGFQRHHHPRTRTSGTMMIVCDKDCH